MLGSGSPKCQRRYSRTASKNSFASLGGIEIEGAIGIIFRYLPTFQCAPVILDPTQVGVAGCTPATSGQSSRTLARARAECSFKTVAAGLMQYAPKRGSEDWSSETPPTRRACARPFRANHSAAIRRHLNRASFDYAQKRAQSDDLAGCPAKIVHSFLQPVSGTA
jgi:hypothetical protein